MLNHQSLSYYNLIILGFITMPDQFLQKLSHFPRFHTPRNKTAMYEFRNILNLESDALKDQTTRHQKEQP